MKDQHSAFAVVNCTGKEESRYLYREMAEAVAERYSREDPIMRAWAPYSVREVAADAPRLS